MNISMIATVAIRESISAILATVFLHRFTVWEGETAGGGEGGGGGAPVFLHRLSVSEGET